jgi:hypothetical protein
MHYARQTAEVARRRPPGGWHGGGPPARGVRPSHGHRHAGHGASCGPASESLAPVAAASQSVTVTRTSLSPAARPSPPLTAAAAPSAWPGSSPPGGDFATAAEVPPAGPGGVAVSPVWEPAAAGAASAAFDGDVRALAGLGGELYAGCFAAVT